MLLILWHYVSKPPVEINPQYRKIGHFFTLLAFNFLLKPQRGPVGDSHEVEAKKELLFTTLEENAKLLVRTLQRVLSISTE